MKHTRAIATVRELCSLGLPSELFIPALLEAMHAVVPSARNLFDWIDGGGRIERYYFEGAIDGRITRLYFDEFYNRRESEAMPRFWICVGSTIIRSAQELDRTSFYNSALYNEIWRPQDLHYHLEGIIRRDDGKALGSIVLYRQRRDPVFIKEKADPARDAHRVHRPRDAGEAAKERAIRRQQAQSSGRSGSSGSDSIFKPGSARAPVARARQHHPSLAGAEPCANNFPTLTMLCRALARSTDALKPVLVTLDDGWGRYELHALPLEPADAKPPPMIAVTIQRMEAAEVSRRVHCKLYRCRSAEESLLAASERSIAAGDRRRLGVAPNR